MDRPDRSLKWRTILLTLLGLVAVGVSVWWTFRANVSAFVKRQQLLDKLRTCNDPVDRDLGRGEPRVGTPVGEWATAHPPKFRFKHDEYETLRYEATIRRTDLTVIAVEGVIVYAGTNTMKPEGAFVGNLSSAEEQAYTASVMKWRQNYIHGRAAAFGVAYAGSPSPSDFPTPLLDDLSETP